MEELTTVTYHFEDGGKQVSSINNAILRDDKGRLRSEQQIMKVFEDTAHDLGAIKFEV
jgi:hypothetical protein